MSFKHAWVVLLALGLLTIAISLPYILLGQTIEPKGTLAAKQIEAMSPDIGQVVFAMIRLIGLCYLVIGILLSGVSITAYRKGEMWPWYLLWLAVPVFTLGDIVNNLSISGSAWTSDAVLLAITVITLLVSPQFSSVLSRNKKLAKFHLNEGKRLQNT